MRALTSREYQSLLFFDSQSFEECQNGAESPGLEQDIFDTLPGLELRGLLRDEPCALCIDPSGGPAVHVVLTDLGKLAVALVRSGAIVLTP